jgi:hypothetical protein
VAWAVWAAWIIDPKNPKNFGAKPKQIINYSSRVRNGPAVLLPADYSQSPSLPANMFALSASQA